MRPFADFGFAMASHMSLSHLLRELPNKRPHKFLLGAGNQALAPRERRLRIGRRLMRQTLVTRVFAVLSATRTASPKLGEPDLLRP